MVFLKPPMVLPDAVNCWQEKELFLVLFVFNASHLAVNRRL